MLEIMYAIPPPSVNWLEVAAVLQWELMLTTAAVLIGACGIIRELCDRVK